MKKRGYSAVALTLVALILVVASYGLTLPRGVASANSLYQLCEESPAHDSDSPGEGVVLQASHWTDASHMSERWGVSRIEAPQAWLTTTGDESIIVAVLDTGINRDNPGLAQRVVADINFTESPTSDDLYGHGTHIAGTIAAIAPDCRLMNVKVADDRGRSEASVVARGVVWAVDHGATVINISLSMKASPDLERAIDYAWDRGAIVIAAAGNLGRAEPVYPAYYANCLAVAATNERDSLALLSSHGYWVDVAAPGFNIYSELPEGRYGYKTGTSTAAAHVSGVAALVFSVAAHTSDDRAMNERVRLAIEDSCIAVDGEGMGSGIVNAHQAVTAVISLTSP